MLYPITITAHTDRHYYFTFDNRTEKEFLWNKAENRWDALPWYRDPVPVNTNKSEQEESTSHSDSDSSHNQIPINTQNLPLIANMSGQTSGTTPSMAMQPGRGKVKLPDNYTGDHIESQKFMLQCLLLFAAESNRYKTN